MKVRCPHCHNAIEVVPEVPLDLLTCPSCGSHLDFLNETLTQRTQEARTVGHFALQELVGLGHFGEVWMARDTQLERTVAIKIPRTKELTPASVELFRREASAAAQLRHPHIVTVHEVGRDGDTLYIVSDFIRGVTLANYITEHRYAPRDAAALCATVAEALHHAHEAGVVHRDLKPGNIMLDGENRPHLMDFGLAKREAGEATVTAAGKILGTPAYMSPEQARGDGHQADRKSDIYSLGVILYELLAGERPFKGDTRLLLHQVQFEEPRPPRKRDKRVPRDLETICLKAMAKRPERRYATAQEMAADLHRYLRGEPIAAKRVSRVERAWRWGRRNPLHAATAVLSVALVAYSLVAFSVWYMHLPETCRVTLAIDTPTLGSGIRVVFVPIDGETGEPDPGGRVRPQGTNPVSVSLAPGTYLVVADVPGHGFQEIYRTVPSAQQRTAAVATYGSDTIWYEGNYLHRKWRNLGRHHVELGPITVLPGSQVTLGMADFAGGTFAMGDDRYRSYGLPAHQRTVAPFSLDTMEVSIGDFLRLDPLLMPGLLVESEPQPDESQPVTFVNFAMALEYAERVGKRLPTEAEFEFAATGGGTRTYPSAKNDTQYLAPWKYGAAGEPDFDQTPTKPPVFGLYSNVAELTDSWHLPYPGQSPLPAMIRDMAGFNRMVRGGPPFVLERQTAAPEAAGSLEVTMGPRQRHSVTLDRQYPGLGFRCARSAKPRFLD